MWIYCKWSCFHNTTYGSLYLSQSFIPVLGCVCALVYLGLEAEFDKESSDFTCSHMVRWLQTWLYLCFLSVPSSQPYFETAARNLAVVVFELSLSGLSLGLLKITHFHFYPLCFGLLSVWKCVHVGVTYWKLVKFVKFRLFHNKAVTQCLLAF